MIGAIFYIVSFIFAVSLLVLLPKRKEPASLFVDILFSYVTVLCVATVPVFVLNFVGIPINQFLIGGLFAIIGILAGLKLLLVKRKQQHYIKKNEVIFVIILILAVGVFALYIFTPYIHANYFNPVDPYHHFLYASETIRSGRISDMFVNPMYNGMFMQLFSWALPQSWLYKAFILSDIYHIVLELLFFYAVLLIIFENKIKKYTLLVISLFYWGTFLMFSFLWGFVYWSMAAMLAEYVLVLLKLLLDKKDSVKTLLILIISGIFATTMCYIAFAPGVVLSVLGVIIYYYLKNHDIKWNKQMQRYSLLVVSILVIIAILGYYFVFYRRGFPLGWVMQMGDQQNIGLELLLLFPLVIYTMVITIRERANLTALQVAYILQLILQMIFTILSICHIISTYYLQKTYFLLFFLSIVIIGEHGAKWTKKNAQYVCLYFIGVFGIMVLSYDGKESDTISLQQSTMVQNLDVLSEFDFSNGVLSDNGKIYLMQYAMEEVDDENNVISLITSTGGNKGIGLWLKATYEDATFISLDEVECSPEKMDALLAAKGATHFMIFFDDLLYIDELNDYFNSFERVYQNDAGFIGKL